MPLAWADVSGVTRAEGTQRLPAEVCVFTVFLCPGFWHGNTLPFCYVGPFLQACYRLGENCCTAASASQKKKARVRKPRGPKRAGVFALVREHGLFQVGSSPAGLTVGDAFRLSGRLFHRLVTRRFCPPSCTPPRPTALRQRHHGGRVLRLHGAGAGAGVFIWTPAGRLPSKKARRDLPCQRKAPGHRIMRW